MRLATAFKPLVRRAFSDGHLRAAHSWLLLFSLAGTALAQQSYFKNWTTKDGLPQDNVNNIAQTPDGYLWVSTVDGLARFDGVHFKVFNKANTPEMPNNRIFAMFTDTAGRLWFNYQNDETVVVYENGRFKAFEKGRDFVKDESASAAARYNNEYNRNLLRVPEMRFRAGEVEYVYRNGAFAAVPAGDYVLPARVFATDLEGVWIDDGDLLYRVKDGRLTRYPKSAPLPFDPREAYPIDSAERDGALWFTSEPNHAQPDERLCSFKDGELRVFPVGPGINDLEFDSKGDLWISLQGRGINKIDAVTIARRDPSNFPVKLESASNGWKLFRDRDQNLWFGGTGLFLINADPAVTLFSKSTGLPADNVYPIVQDAEGTIWFGAWPYKLVSYRDGVFSSETSSALNSLFVDSRARLWAGSGPQIQYRENGKWTTVDFVKTLPPPWDLNRFMNAELAFITEDAQGHMWFGNQAGLIRYSPDGSKVFTVDDGLPSNLITSYLFTRRGEFWVGTNGGIARMEGDRFRAFTEADGLAGNFTRSLYEDADGTIWIGGYDGGLTRLRDGVFRKITTSDGLFSNGVFVILEDDGWFWMNSNQGIYRVRRQELNDFADGKIESVTSISYGPEDGLLEIEGNGGKQPAGIKSADGRLWFPMAHGLAVIDPKAVKRNSVSPPVLIEDVRIDQKEFEASAGGIRVEPNQAAIEIDYTALGFVGAQRMRFRYRLEGLENAWTEAGSRRTAYFSHLPDGEYTFRVIAANSDGVWNNEGAAIKVTILPPFYRKWWFYALAIIAVFGLTTFIYLFRLRQLQKMSDARAEFSRRLIESQESERRRIALELHDSLGQTLAVIRNGTLLGLDAEDAGQAREQLQQISEAATLALRETREIAHNLHPAQINNLGLTSALRALIRSVELATGMKCAADIGESPANLSYDAAINIYRITQESLSNIIKHSVASSARITLAADEKNLVLTIDDDGRGFVESQVTRGLGLTSLRERATMIGADLTIASQPGEGTKITLTLPLDRPM